MSVDQVVVCTPKNDPPVISVGTKPTILLRLEGKPAKDATRVALKV